MQMFARNISSTASMSTHGVPLLAVLLAAAFFGVMGYTRPPPGKTLFIERPADLAPNAPEQVHISLVGADKVRVSFVTIDAVPTTVHYGTSPGKYEFSSSDGYNVTYDYTLYKSGIISHVVIGPLKPNTVYYYRCGTDASREFSFKTPPSQLPLKFAVSGDLGQTEHTQSTLDHISHSNYDVLLLPGDLAYADTIQNLWDSFGRLVEPLASQRPWMVTQGNHEVEKIPIVHSTPFTAYNSRWRNPYEQSGSSSNLYYSFDVAGTHIIMLGSYTDFEEGSDQYKWLQADLAKIDRSRTPWIVALVHAPWYNSNEAHQGESESVNMKASMEELLYNARVDVVFQGHVHAYERFTRVNKDAKDDCAPVYITIGDGGNREGLAKRYINPEPEISIFREASFGHGELEVFNATHAFWTWYRNGDSQKTISDSVWLTSLSSNPKCKRSTRKLK